MKNSRDRSAIARVCRTRAAVACSECEWGEKNKIYYGKSREKSKEQSAGEKQGVRAVDSSRN